MDFEQSKNNNVIMSAVGNKIYSLHLDSLAIIKSYEMPNPMHFKEEGGVSLSPDGKTFLAVCYFVTFVIILRSLSN